MACLPGQIPKSKIPLSSFHLISGAMLAFPPGKLPFAIWQTYPDPPPESRSHLDSSHLDLGITLHSSDQVFGYHNAGETEKSQNQFSKTLQKNQNQKTRHQKNTLGAQMASHHQVATHHQGPMACLPGQIPKSKISLSSFHLISGAMLAFPPGKLPFAIWQTYPDPPPESRSHLDSSHLDLGITFAFL